MVMLEPRRGLWFKLTVDATHELAREDDRVGALVTVAAQQGEHAAFEKREKLGVGD